MQDWLLQCDVLANSSSHLALPNLGARSDVGDSPACLLLDALLVVGDEQVV